MSSSQDVLPSPVAIGAPAPSPPQIPGERVRLCETCQKTHEAALRDDGPDWKEFDDHDGPHIEIARYSLVKYRLPADEWPDLPRLLHSAKAGCGFCAFIREAILSHDFKDAWENLTEAEVTEAEREKLGIEFQYGRPRDHIVGDPHDKLQVLVVSITIGASDLKVRLYFRIKAYNDCPVIAKWLVLRPPAIRNHEDYATISFLKTELQKLHDESHADFLPERLLEVGASSLRLVERNNIIAGSAKRPQYAALSYCWGRREHAGYQSKITNRNRNYFLERLDSDALSPVLKDAVKITRCLSIPYLWVDSLCILQNDQSDWQRQCSQMNDIYGKACVTLIAAFSRTCREGFLNPTRYWLQFPYQSALRPSIRGSFMMHFSHTDTMQDFGLERTLLKISFVADGPAGAGRSKKT
ncbi:hypothetical protein N8I77_013369 [Diaporthe amygdali]|uniref:Heterokaryon incompatibility domain-containing protein n=1 Tax=Phomopsis amygdali TaxID=1214568 RepID=A0AAD9VWN2_PHOAM|nr:hypothetical protein N8I77_013369 [Diaporthe amygdali]